VIDNTLPFFSSSSAIPTLSKRENRALLSSRPPASNTDTFSTHPAASVISESHDEDAPSLLANDLALRRLLAESHLLLPSSTASSSPSAAAPFSTGRTRHRTTDLRLQALGASGTLYAQKRMPREQLQGMMRAAAGREARRRAEAREAGVVLELEHRGGRATKHKRQGRRERDVNAADVGWMKGGTAELRISRQEARSIEGPRRDGLGRGGRKKQR
jgi:hypothetical protein